jgi:hypothetical protein
MMEEAPAVKEEPQDAYSEMGCLSANRVAEKEDTAFSFVDVKGEVEVCS